MALTFTEFLKLLKSKKRFLFDITGWDGSSNTTYRVSDLEKVLNGNPYEPCVKGIPSFSRVMQLWRFASSQTSFGNLTLLNGDGGLDDMHDWIFDGQGISCKLGGASEAGEELSDAEYTEVLKGVMGKPEYSDRKIVIPIRDFSNKLDTKNVPDSFYDGTESGDFPPENIDTTIPLCLGTVKNIKPVLIDSTNMIFQVDPGTINDIPAVYDDGSVFSSFTKDLTSGKFTLTAAPVGGLDKITCDVEGHVDNSVFLQKPGEILNYIAVTYTDLVAGDLDAPSFTQLDVDRPYGMGIYIRDQITVFSVFDDMLMGILADWGFTRTAKLQVLAFELPATFDPNTMEKYEDEEFMTFREKKKLPTIYHRFTIKYAKDWSDDDKTLQEMVENSTTLTNHVNAEEKTLDTYLVNQADATAVGNKLLIIFDGTHYVIEFTIKVRAFVHNFMETIRIDRTNSRTGVVRYGMVDKDFIIIGINENYTGNQITLTCFGG